MITVLPAARETGRSHKNVRPALLGVLMKRPVTTIGHWH